MVRIKQQRSSVNRGKLRLGFVPLSDCAPLVMARELNLFAKYGIDVELRREVGWATIRDKIIYNELDAAHAPAGMVVAASAGLGSIRTDCLTGLIINLHGNAITLSQRLWRRGVRDGESLRREIERERCARKFIFGVVFPFSSHHFLLRSWLRANGIDPDHDVQIVVVPPPQMFPNLKAETLDGYCVGEPWNSLAVLAKAGFVVATSSSLAYRHPEKALMVRREFAGTRETEHLALIAALAEACRFCDAPENRERIMETLTGSEHLNVPVQALRMSMEGMFDFGNGRIEEAADFHVFAGGNANEPDAEKAAWVMRSLRESGPAGDPRMLAELNPGEMFRADIYHQAVQPGSTQSNQPMKKNMKKNTDSIRTASPLTRRRFLTTTAKGIGLAALLNTLPKGWVGSVYADDSPEVADLKFGIIALTDCSSLVIAHEKGLFKKYGINSTIAKGASWAAIRDSLSSGDIQGTHMLTGMPIASTMGLLGSPKKPMIIPWMLNRNGQAITLKGDLKGKVKDDPKALKPFVDAAKAAGAPMTFAMTFPPGTHAMWMRYYLGAGGINPDKEVQLITIPPPQMVANMKVGKMDGFCVGEPWNARSVAEGIGFTSITTQAIWKDHPEKVCAFLAEFADKNPKTVKAALKALHEASVWLDKMENRPEQAKIVSAATYINCPPELILGRLQGRYDMGDGRTFNDPNYMIFSDRNCNYPQPKYAKWWLTQFRRWGMVEGAPDYEGVAKQVMRPDIYEAAMKEIGAAHGGSDNKPETLFDGVTFDPAKPEEYAKGFAINNLKG